LEQCQPADAVERVKPEVVEDDKWRFFELVQELDVGAVELAHGNAFQEPVHSEVQGPVAERTGLSAECAGQIAFAASGGAGDEQVLGTVNEGAVGQRHELFLRQVPVWATVDVFDQRIVTQLALAEVERRARLGALLQLGFGHTGHELADSGLMLHRHGEHGLVGLGHTGEAEFFEPVDGELGVHGDTGCVGYAG